MKRIFLLILLVLTFTISAYAEIIEPRAGYYATREINGPDGDSASWLHQKIMEYRKIRNFRQIRKHIDTGMVIMFYGRKVEIVKQKGDITLILWHDRDYEGCRNMPCKYWWISTEALLPY